MIGLRLTECEIVSSKKHNTTAYTLGQLPIKLTVMIYVTLPAALKKQQNETEIDF